MTDVRMIGSRSYTIYTIRRVLQKVQKSARAKRDVHDATQCDRTRVTTREWSFPCSDDTLHYDTGNANMAGEREEESAYRDHDEEDGNKKWCRCSTAEAKTGAGSSHSS